MTSEGDKWDPATALGFKSSDRTLVVGNPGFMPWLCNVCTDLTAAKKPTELHSLVRQGEVFDRVVVAREVQFSHELIALAGPLLSPTGLLVIFSADDGWAAREAAEFYYPEARSWDIDTTYGRALVSEPRGFSWRLYV